MISLRFVLVVIILIYPQWAQSAVIINEVAWMGDEESSNNEWIELYNSGSQAVNVDGWVLEDDANLSINLAGEIAPGAYAVLERTDDDSSPASAFLIYTGALVNSGVTLTLYDAADNMADRVAGGEGWQNIGGDNDTKETAQYTNNGWVTNTPTPGTKNKNTNSATYLDKSATTESSSKTDEENEETTNNAQDTKSSSKSSGDSQLTPTNAKLNLSIKAPETIYVNQPVNLEAVASGIGKTIIASLSYVWNFGDSYQAKGSEVTHTYSYPGTYMVVLNASYAEREVSVNRKVTVLPVNFSLTKNDDGDIQVHNDSPYEVDMSGYFISGNKKIMFPPETKILPRSTITIAKERLGGTDNMVALYDNQQAILTSTFDNLLREKTKLANNQTGNVIEESEENNLVSYYSPQTPMSTITSEGGAGNSVVESASSESFVFGKQLAQASEIETSDSDQNDANDDANVEAEYKPESSEKENTKTKQTENNTKQWPYFALLALVLLVLVLFKKR